MIPDVICPYCDNEAKLVTGKDIYGGRPELWDLSFWLCRPCYAYVGCHPKNKRLGLKGNEPFGALADRNLRWNRMRAHKAFDPLWKVGVRSRRKAYEWLAEQLKIPVEECHIGMFTYEQCDLTIQVCKPEVEKEKKFWKRLG